MTMYKPIVKKKGDEKGFVNESDNIYMLPRIKNVKLNDNLRLLIKG